MLLFLLKKISTYRVKYRMTGTCYIACQSQKRKGGLRILRLLYFIFLYHYSLWDYLGIVSWSGHPKPEILGWSYCRIYYVDIRTWEHDKKYMDAFVFIFAVVEIWKLPINHDKKIWYPVIHCDCWPKRNTSRQTQGVRLFCLGQHRCIS